MPRAIQLYNRAANYGNTLANLQTASQLARYAYQGGRTLGAAQALYNAGSGTYNTLSRLYNIATRANNQLGNLRKNNSQAPTSKRQKVNHNWFPKPAAAVATPYYGGRSIYYRRGYTGRRSYKRYRFFR